MKNIKQFNDFAGEDGYLIVDGLSNEVEGGRKKLSDVKNEIIGEIPEPPEQVNADWNAESGKAQILNVPDVLKEIPEPDYSSSGTVLSVKSGELRWDWPQIDIDDYVDGVTIDADANNSLYVLNPLPEDVGKEGDVLTVENGEPTWKELEIPNVPIESISIDNTELVPDENKNVNIAIESDCGLYVNNNNELSFGVDSGDTSPLCIRSSNELSFQYDGTLTIVHSGSNENYLSVAIPVPKPSADHSDIGKVLTVQQASNPNNSDEIVWAAPTGLTKAEADSYYAPKSEFDDLVAWLAPISANLVIAASNN